MKKFSFLKKILKIFNKLLSINREVYDIELDGKIFNAKDIYEIGVKT